MRLSVLFSQRAMSDAVTSQHYSVRVTQHRHVYTVYCKLMYTAYMLSVDTVQQLDFCTYILYVQRALLHDLITSSEGLDGLLVQYQVYSLLQYWSIKIFVSNICIKYLYPYSCYMCDHTLLISCPLPPILCFEKKS